MREKVQRLCQRLELAPDELANRLGVSRQIVLNWMSGRVKESSRSCQIDTAIKALEEGFDRQFVLDRVLVDGPLSIRQILASASEAKSTDSSSSAGGGADGGPDRTESGDLMGDIERASQEAYRKGHFIQSALILFQALETLLRIYIKTHGQRRGVHESVLAEAADKEQSFLRLTLHLDLIHPENGYSNDLRRLNRRRNDTMHRLFYEYESRDEMEEKLREFCLEAQTLRDGLAKEIRDCIEDLKVRAGAS